MGEVVVFINLAENANNEALIGEKTEMAAIAGVTGSHKRNQYQRCTRQRCSVMVAYSSCLLLL